jgi:GMC oxidoreductase
VIYEDFNKFITSGFTPKVCIIGSGPAGISLALQLEKQKIPSLIIEAGNLNYSVESQDAYKGNVIGDEYPELHAARLRYFGGTSGHWGGYCRPLDDVDFEVRKGFKNSGWPIRKRDLDPYAKDTESILEIDKFPENIRVNDNLQEVFFRFSPPVRFGDKYLQHIKKSSLISLLINSPVKSLAPTNKKISHIHIHSEKNKDQKIQANYFCLCAGGIENSRMLLWSNKLHNNGVVPHAKALGKYWMEHPHFNVGQTIMFQPTAINRDETNPIFFAPTPKFLHESGVGNFALRIHPSPGLDGLIKDGACTAAKLFSKLASKPIELGRCTQNIKVAWGQLPISSNRIELNDEKDAIGIPRVNLYWKKQPIDRVTAQATAKLFGTYLLEKDIGRMKLSSWLADGHDYPSDDEKIGYHHMGGTRMASTSEKGVVDSNCKVFGVENLFVGGSSVFATAGHANPTYAIVQLALRLGKHIAKLESAREGQTSKKGSG